MCDGRPPFAGTREEVLAVIPAEPPSLKRRDLPVGLRDLIASLLAPNPDQRPATAVEVKDRLIELRAARENLERLLASNVGAVLQPALSAYLTADVGALIESPSAVSLQDDHRYLMLAIRELAETDCRRAVIDAATAAEIALRSAISSCLQRKGWSLHDIDRVIRSANGVSELFTNYTKLAVSRMPRVSRPEVIVGLGQVRNHAAHEERVPSFGKAVRAVEVAYHLVTAIHPVVG
jgi:hypothetical protein